MAQRLRHEDSLVPMQPMAASADLGRAACARRPKAGPSARSDSIPPVEVATTPLEVTKSPGSARRTRTAVSLGRDARHLMRGSRFLTREAGGALIHLRRSGAVLFSSRPARSECSPGTVQEGRAG
jgi:hypothetical protein